MIPVCCFTILSLLSVINLSAGKLCPANRTAANSSHDDTTWTTDSVECPTSEYPKNHIECCGPADVTQPQCCLPGGRFYEIDSRIATAIAASVITCCIAVAVLVLVCCFWSRCPLYNTCRAHYTDSGVVIYAPTDCTSNVMPSEPENKSKNVYAPNVLSNGAAV